MDKKGAMGINTLVLLVALLIVAAVVASVVIISVEETREGAMETGKQARGQISTHASAYEVTATNGLNHTLNYFRWILKLTSGSNDIDLKTATVYFTTGDKQAVLNYRQNGVIEKSNSGYNTWNAQEFGDVWVNEDVLATGPSLGGFPYIGNTVTSINLDLNLDGINDTAWICDAAPPPYCPSGMAGTHMAFNVSGDRIYYVNFINRTGSEVNISQATVTPVSLFVNNSPIGSYGYAYINGTTEQNYALRSWASVLSVVAYRNPDDIEEDLDDDGVDDTIGLNRTHLTVSISNYGRILIPLDNPLTGAAAQDIDIDLSNGTGTVGNLRLSGTSTIADRLDASMTFTVTPENLYRGYYVVEYLIEGQNHKEGVFTRGDMIQIHMEPPDDISEAEDVKLVFMPSLGTSTITEFDIPTVLNTERIVLFP